MTEHVYTATVSGNSLDELKVNAQKMADALSVGAPRLAQGEDLPPAQEEAVAPEVPLGRKRGRPPAAASSSTNGTSPEKSVEDMRQEATDILKTCWGKKNSPGAEKVVALQKKFGVTRFGEVTDDKVPSLLQAAVALQKELAGETASDTGPF